MTTTDLAVYTPRDTLALAPEAWTLAQKVATTDFVPDAFRGKPEAVLACFLAGAEVGISPMQALQKIHVIEGRPAMAAELMRALIQRAGHELWIEESSTTRCTIGGKRAGSERETKVTWTLDDAERAGLNGKNNWRKYPAAMLLARATAQLGRFMFADVLAGISYTVEELEDGDILEATATIGDGDGTPPKPTQRRRAARTATRGALSASAPDAPAPEAPKAETPPLPGEEDAGEASVPAAAETREPSPAPTDDDVVDAELVDAIDAEEDEGLFPDAEAPDERQDARTYTPTQVLAMRATERGLDRDGKLAFAGAVLGRTVATTKDLAPNEVRALLEVLNDDDAFADAMELVDIPAPTRTPEPAPRRRRRTESPAPPVAIAPPDQWDAAAWRDFLASRGVKAAELLREAARLAKEVGSPPPTTLDALAGFQSAGDLVGYVEDLALERGK